MHSWSNRYLVYLLILGAALFSIGYNYYTNQTMLSELPANLILSSPQEVKLASSVPNLHLSAKRQVFSPVELRRADLAMGMVDQEAQPQSSPLLDKVLFVPKKFKQQA